MNDLKQPISKQQVSQMLMLPENIFLQSMSNIKQLSILSFSTTEFKNRLWHRCFLVNFAKFLRTAFTQNTSGGLLQPLFVFL